MRLAIAVLAALLLAAPAAAEPLFGVYSEDRPTPRMKAAGFDALRKPFTWSVVQPRPGRFDWTILDQIVAEAAVRNLTTFPFLLGPPRWATGQPRGEEGMRPPKDPRTFARFAAAAVRRYGPDGTLWELAPYIPKKPIRAWQIWNEPNLPAFWQPRPNAKAYVKLLRSAAKAIHDVDRGATVVAAGLPESRVGVPQLDYLKDAYRARLHGAADALAIHAYAPDAPGVIAYVSRFRTLMNAKRDDSPLWLTEFGWADGGDPSLFTVSSGVQTALLTHAVRGLRSLARPFDLGAMFAFRWRDAKRTPGIADIWPFHAGLVTRKGRPKPALDAYRRALSDPVKTSRAKRPGELDITVTPTGSAASVSCSQRCRVGVSVVKSVERAGRSPLEKVPYRAGANLAAGRTKRFQTGRLAGRELLVSGYTASGGAAIVSLP